MSERHRIHVEFGEDWAPIQFYGDPPAGRDTSEAGCAEQARAYIEKNGMYRFLSDWGIDVRFDVWVGSTMVAQDGRVLDSGASR